MKRTFQSMLVLCTLALAVVAFTAPAAQAWTGGTQGCTPGFWKNHTSAWPTPYTPGEVISTVYTSPALDSSLASQTLLDALSFQGGSTLVGAQEILLRASVAGLLNAADPSINYGVTPTQVINQTDNAMTSGKRARMINLANRFDAQNNLGCPLS